VQQQQRASKQYKQTQAHATSSCNKCLAGLTDYKNSDNCNLQLNSNAQPAIHQTAVIINISKTTHNKQRNHSTIDKIKSDATANNQPITINIKEQQVYYERFSYSKSELCFDIASGDIFNSSNETAIANCSIY
jgi:hypothetical protein